MSSEVMDDGARELKVEHVLAALNQITELVSQVHKALDGLDPKLVLRSGSGDAKSAEPMPRFTVSQC